MSSLLPVVRAFIFNPEGQILLTRHTQKSPWVLPGGHVEAGESLHTAMIREIQEEFGITARFFEIDGEEQLYHMGQPLHHYPAPISTYELSYTGKDGKDKSRIEYVFLMETDDTIQQVQTEEIAAYEWFEVDDILGMKPNVETWDFMIQMLEKIVGEDVGEDESEE